MGILNTIKKMLGIDAEYTHFDTDIIININSVLMFINQLGIGPEEPFLITSDTETWSDLLGVMLDVEAVKTYVYLKVRLLFDPPMNAFAVEAIERQIAQFEWRLNVQVDKSTIDEVIDDEDDE